VSLLLGPACSACGHSRSNHKVWPNYPASEPVCEVCYAMRGDVAWHPFDGDPANCYAALRGDGACACGAPQVWRIYATAEQRAKAEAEAKEAGMTYRFCWKDTAGYGFQATYEHSHLSQRP